MRDIPVRISLEGHQTVLRPMPIVRGHPEAATILLINNFGLEKYMVSWSMLSFASNRKGSAWLIKRDFIKGLLRAAWVA